MKIENIVFYLTFTIFIAVSIYSYQMLKKNYYGTQLLVVAASLENILKRPMSPAQKALIMRNALPVLNEYKLKFFKYYGYWLDIYNVYNQAAMVEWLNGNRREALRLLLVSIRYHPYLSETYRAMSVYSAEVGMREASKYCLQTYQQLLSTQPLNLAIRQKCLQAVKDFLKKN